MFQHFTVTKHRFCTKEFEKTYYENRFRKKRGFVNLKIGSVITFCYYKPEELLISFFTYGFGFIMNIYWVYNFGLFHSENLKLDEFSQVHIQLRRFLSSSFCFYVAFQPLSAWCPLKGHTDLNKPVAESCRFVYVCVTF